MSFFNTAMKMMGKVELIHRDKEGSILNTRNFENVVTQSGAAVSARLLCGNTSTAATYLALGSNLTLIGNSTKTIAEHTAAAAGLGRTAATISIVGISTARWAFTWTCGSDGMIIQEECIGHQPSTASELIAAQTFGSITLDSGDTLQVNHDISFS